MFTKLIRLIHLVRSFVARIAMRFNENVVGYVLIEGYSSLLRVEM